MTHVIETTADEIFVTKVPGEETPGLLKRSAVFIYGALAYNVGVAGLLWLILALGGLAPVGLSAWQANTTAMAILVNLGLVSLFGLQHSLMARPFFKSWLARYLPQAAERSTYMVASGIVTITAIYFWQPVPGIVWQVENGVVALTLWTVYALAFAYLFIATFVTNHFELMGLRQVYLYFVNKPYTSLPFTKKFMYRYSRHPMMLGFLVGLWSVPVMSVSHFVMSTLFTLYIFIGVAFEERGLMMQFGETYRKYKAEIGMFFPKIY